jgi:C_GCAxxG_C_C family probable redox protein
VLAVGEHLWGRVDDQFLRATTGLGGGLGGSQQELCGVLSGGTMIIGACHGRTSPDQNDDECYERACLYRERFLEAFGTTRCFDLRASGYGSEGQWPCSVLVERATRILMEVLDQARP